MTACKGDRGCDIVAFEVAQCAQPPGFAMSPSVVRENVEGSSPDALGQSDDVRVILRRRQTVHKDDNRPRVTVA